MSKKTDAILNEEAYRYLRNTLNEVLHGIWPSIELERRFGSLHAPMKALLEEMEQHRSRHVLSPEQARLLMESCDICETELGSEFETRLGYSRAEAGRVVAELNRMTRHSHAAAS